MAVQTDTGLHRTERYFRMIYFWIAYLAALILVFQYYINPQLIYQAQEPPFFTDSSFLQQHLTYPGGLADYLGAFLTQCFYYDWIGSIVLAGIVLLVCLVTYGLLRKWAVSFPWILLCCLPGAFLLALHIQFQHPLSSTLALLLCLTGVWIQQYFQNKPTWLNVLIFFILGSAVFYLAGGLFLLFAFMTIIDTLDSRNQYSRMLPYGLITLLVPYIAAKFIFIISINQAYAYLIPGEALNEYAWVGYALMALYPVLLISAKIYFSRQRAYAPVLKILIPVILLGITGSALFTRDRIQRTHYQVLKLARQKQWSKLLDFAGQLPFQTPIFSVEINRALYHTPGDTIARTRLLGETMFSYSQPFGAKGLLISDQTRVHFPMEKSDLTLDLGFVNESIHWASEALSAQGETPYSLKRLATLYMVKGEFKIAQIYINRLKRTVLYKKWAYQAESNITSDYYLHQDSWIREMRQNLMKTDHIVENANPCLSLEKIIRKNPENRMAYDYLLTYALLSKNIPAFIETIARANTYYPILLPKHYEEAILLYIYVLKGSKLDLKGFKIRKTSYEQRFKTFQSIFEKAGGNPTNAKPAMFQFLKDSYWYYYLYQDTGNQ
ncbi:hypothetical protein JW835_05495 [bacterium]|nr:hypothetical protein [bacterium]